MVLGGGWNYLAGPEWIDLSSLWTASGDINQNTSVYREIDGEGQEDLFCVCVCTCLCGELW